MIINSPQINIVGGKYLISSDVITNDGNYNLWYKTNSEINISSEIFLTATVIPAMWMNENITVNGSVSKILYNNINKIQNIFSWWYADAKNISIDTNVNEHKYPSDNRDVACFFTGGVDSFYTLLKHIDEIGTIIYVHGFDAWLHETEYLSMVSKRLNIVAMEMNKKIIEVESNIHPFGDKYVNWGFHYFGSALASVAMLLSKEIKKVYIGSGKDYKNLIPCGSHPELDYLWSTENVEIVHDGCDATRMDKIKSIINNKSVLNHLRVCFDRTNGLYNCSVCEKCIRTMITLHSLGYLDKCNTFENLDISLISKMRIEKNTLLYAIENYNELPDGEIKSNLKIAIDSYKNR